MLSQLFEKINRRNFLIICLPVIYLLFFLSFSNKVFLLILIIIFFIFLIKFKNIKLSLWILYLLVLPFEKGKGFSFTLLPDYLTSNNMPYNYWFTITFADIIFFFLIYIILKEKMSSRKKKNFKNEKSKVDFLIFGFLILSFLTVFNSPDRFVSFLGFIRLSRMIGAYLLTREIFQVQKNKLLSLITISSSLLFQGLWASVQFLKQGSLGRDLEHIGDIFSPYGHLTVETPYIFRSSGTFVHPNSLASFAVIIFVLIFSQVFNNSFRKHEKLFFKFSLLMGALALLFSSSRAAWVVFVTMIIINFYYLFKKGIIKISFVKLSKKYLVKLLLPLLFCLLLMVPRILSLSQSIQKFGGAYYRIDLLEKSLIISQRHPLGIGLEVFPAFLVNEFGDFFTNPAPAHNLFMQISVAVGISGLALFLIIQILSFKRFFISKQSKGLGLIRISAFFSVLSFLALGNFYPLFLIPNVSEYFWIALAILNL